MEKSVENTPGISWFLYYSHPENTAYQPESLPLAMSTSHEIVPVASGILATTGDDEMNAGSSPMPVQVPLPVPEEMMLYRHAGNYSLFPTCAKQCLPNSIREAEQRHRQIMLETFEYLNREYRTALQNAIQESRNEVQLTQRAKEEKKIWSLISRRRMRIMKL